LILVDHGHARKWMISEESRCEFPRGKRNNESQASVEAPKTAKIEL
jgi:hypothetical protein